MRIYGLALVAGLLGCQQGSASSFVCSFPADIDSGAGEADVDGDYWFADDVAWTETGSSIQITTGMSEGWRLTVVIQEDALDDNGLGIVELDGSGGWALMYPESGSSYSSQQGAGSLELVARDDNIQACMEFEASGTDGDLSLENGYLHAEILDLGR